MTVSKVLMAMEQMLYDRKAPPVVLLPLQSHDCLLGGNFTLVMVFHGYMTAILDVFPAINQSINKSNDWVHLKST